MNTWRVCSRIATIAEKNSALKPIFSLMSLWGGCMSLSSHITIYLNLHSFSASSDFLPILPIISRFRFVLERHR